MSSPSSSSRNDDSSCCGIQIDFYEICGHTLTLTDHASTCTHSNPFLDPPPAAYIPSRSLPSTSLRPIPQTHTPTPIPDPKLNCLDLHRFIRLIPSQCTCSLPLQESLYLTNTSTPIRSDPYHNTIPKEIITHRRSHFLHQRHLAINYEKSGRTTEMKYALNSQRALEMRLRVPRQKRVYIFDPAGQVGSFFERIDSKAFEEKRCGVCRELLSDGRRLPCGCVVDLGCVVGWLRERKDCAICGVLFRLVDVSSVRGEERREVDWVDDELDDGFL